MYKLRQDYILIALILLLTLLGLVTLYSASYLLPRFKSGLTPLVSNLIVFGIMLAVFPITALISLDKLKNGKVVIGLIVFALLLNLIPIFQKIIQGQVKGVMRWIVLKVNEKEFSFQPSELFKIALPFYMAYILDKNKNRLNSFFYGPFPSAVITGLFCGLVLWQKNYSEIILILVVSVIISFAAGIRFRWFLLLLFLLILAVFLLFTFGKTGTWHERFDSFINKEKDLFTRNYQPSASLDAIKEGGFWGKGIGQGTYKMGVPEVHGDFVFAAYAEESGLLGVLFYLFLIGAFVYIGYMTAWRSQDRFKQLLAFGLVTTIAVQTLTNIAVVVRLIPTTGIPLPFVSSGGSSLLVTLIVSGLLVNITRCNVKSCIGGRNVR